MWNVLFPSVLSRLGSTRVPPRNVYIDLGVNWCNTLQLHRDLADAFPPPRPTQRFEVYGFEASPLLHQYIDDYVRWLNGKTPSAPFTCLPRSGSTVHLATFAASYGCGHTNNNTEMRECMWTKLKSHLEEFELKGIAYACAYNSSSLISKRLEVAKMKRSAGSRIPQYTFIPAAASDKDSFATIAGSAQAMIRGGSHIDEDHKLEELNFRVRTVDIPTWIAESFTSDDFVQVKMDVEGAEFAILNSMVRQKTAGLIDVLAWECHANRPICSKLKAKVAAFNVTIVDEMSRLPRTGYFYDGVDSATKAREHNFSHTSDFKKFCL
eukprot:6174447-Pleurochrysis_carterae.AAC.1